MHFGSSPVSGMRIGVFKQQYTNHVWKPLPVIINGVPGAGVPPLRWPENTQTDKLYFVYKIFNKNVNLRFLAAADGLLIKVTGPQVVSGGLLKIKITFVLLPNPPPPPTDRPFTTCRRGPFRPSLRGTEYSSLGHISLGADIANRLVATAQPGIVYTNTYTHTHIMSFSNDFYTRILSERDESKKIVW